MKNGKCNKWWLTPIILWILWRVLWEGQVRGARGLITLMLEGYREGRRLRQSPPVLERFLRVKLKEELLGDLRYSELLIELLNKIKKGLSWLGVGSMMRIKLQKFQLLKLHWLRCLLLKLMRKQWPVCWMMWTCVNNKFEPGMMTLRKFEEWSMQLKVTLIVTKRQLIT